MTNAREKPRDQTERNSSRKIKKGRAFQRKLESLSKWLISIKWNN